MAATTDTATAMGTRTITTMDEAALYRLMAWLSPSYPVGAFSHSHGLEWAVEAGDVTDAATLKAWVADILRHGAGRQDAILFAQTHDAAERDDRDMVADIAELAVALNPARERRIETLSQGRAFLIATRAAWPAPRDPAAGIDPERIAYAVAVALAAAAHSLPCAPALIAYLHAFAANIVSAGVRLVPLGQTDGQRVIAALEPAVHEVAGTAATASLDDLGGAAFLADIAAMRHETQYTRLFRT